MKKILLFSLILLPLFTFAQILISTTGGAVTENFNGIGATATATLPSNFKVDKNDVSYRTLGVYSTATSATERTGGESVATNAGNGIYNVGIAPDATSTDRAIGFLSATSATRSGNLYAFLRNNSSTAIQSFTISYNVEKYRNGTNAAGFSIQLFYSVDGTTWVSAGSGFTTNFIANADNFGTATPPISTTVVSSSYNPATSITQNGNIYFAWNYSVTSTNTSSNAQLLAIDDISITANATLPIQLTAFTGKPLDKSILLNWNTASEINNDYFDVQRSADGKSFTSIGTVKGGGTSTSSLDYAFTDENPFAGTNYYQLVQHDFDGKTSSSKIIGIDSKIAGAQLNVYAETSQLKIFISSPNQTSGKVAVYDIVGKKLYENNVQINKGYNDILIPLTLPSGIHLVRYISESENLVKKFVK